LIVTSRQKSTSLWPTELAMLPIRPLPWPTGLRPTAGSRRKEAKAAGWPLDDILARADIAVPALVVVRTEDDHETRLDPHDARLRINRRGQYSISYLDATGHPQRLRSVTGIASD
jgi:hypothetical protein